MVFSEGACENIIFLQHLRHFSSTHFFFALSFISHALSRSEFLPALGCAAISICSRHMFSATAVLLGDVYFYA